MRCNTYHRSITSQHIHRSTKYKEKQGNKERSHVLTIAWSTELLCTRASFDLASPLNVYRNRGTPRLGFVIPT